MFLFKKAGSRKTIQRNEESRLELKAEGLLPGRYIQQKLEKRSLHESLLWKRSYTPVSIYKHDINKYNP